MKTANYSDLRSNLKGFLDGVVNNCEPLVIHRSGGNSVVVISLEEYNAIKETEYIRSSPEMMQAIGDSETSIHQGSGTRINGKEELKSFLKSL